MRFMEWLQVIGKIIHGSNYLWSVMKKSSVSRTRRFYVISDSVLCFWKLHQNPQSNTVWEDKLTWFKCSSQCRILDSVDGEPMEFEWNIFPGFTTMQLCNKVKEFMSKMSDQPEEFKGRIIFMSLFKTMNSKMSYARRFSPGRRSYLGLGSEKKWYSICDSKPEGDCDRVAELMIIKIWGKRTPSFPCRESSVPRNAQKQRTWTNVNTFLRWWWNDRNCFSHNYFFFKLLSIFGAVSD